VIYSEEVRVSELTMPTLKSNLLTYIDDVPDTLVMQTLQITTGPVRKATDEWVKTGLANIVAIIGYAVQSTEPGPARVIFRMNARGTGALEGEHPGCLGVESAGDSTRLHVTILGNEEKHNPETHPAD
jgi:hypothetical protein